MLSLLYRTASSADTPTYACLQSMPNLASHIYTEASERDVLAMRQCTDSRELIPKPWQASAAPILMQSSLSSAGCLAMQSSRAHRGCASQAMCRSQAGCLTCSNNKNLPPPYHANTHLREAQHITIPATPADSSLLTEPHLLLHSQQVCMGLGSLWVSERLQSVCQCSNCR